MTMSSRAEAAFQRLRESNARFRDGMAQARRSTSSKLSEPSNVQEPYATIIGCSDSRVAPEIIFDAGMGELFVIRVAGNVISSEIAGSLQYAAEYLRTPVFLVLGHSGCGAVHAALEYYFRGAKQRSRIQVLVDNILPALDMIDPDLPPAKQLDLAVEANVRWTIKQILESEARHRFASGEFLVEGAVYDVLTGDVRFLRDVQRDQ